LHLSSESVNVSGNRLAGWVTAIWKLSDSATQCDVDQLLLSRIIQVNR
jgi:hypothetical protein